MFKFIKNSTIKLLIALIITSYSICSKAAIVDIYVREGQKIAISSGSFIDESLISSSDKDYLILKTFAETIVNDLNISNDFSAKIDKSIDNQEPSEIKPSDMSSKSVLTIKGKIEMQKKDYVVNISIYENSGAKKISTFRYKINNLGNIRAVAHLAADAISYNITGKQYYFGSKILFISQDHNVYKKNNSDFEYKDIADKILYIVDQDGFRESPISGKELISSPVYSKKFKTVFCSSYNEGHSRIKEFLTAKDGNFSKVSDFIDSNKELQGKDIINISISSNGKKMAIVASSHNGSDIYKLDLTKMILTKLTKKGINTSPSWSPEGDKIVYSSNKTGRSHIYIMTEKGKQQQKITSESGSYREPKWSPDGKHIVFTKIKKSLFGIGIINLNTKEEKIIHSSYLAEKPHWSPCGTMLIFSFKNTAKEKSRLKITSIYNTSYSRIISSETKSYLDPYWFNK